MTCANRRLWQGLILIVISGTVTTAAMAISGQALAIGRAFQYNYNNPQPAIGSGPLGSSVYGPASYNIPGRPFYSPPVAPPPISPLISAARAQQLYAPMAPMTITSSGGSAALTPSGASGSDPIRDAVSVLAQHDTQTTAAPLLTSLAPDGPGTVRGPMIAGEAAMRQGDYKQAARDFEAARAASGSSPEAMLSLVHAYFAIGGQYIGEAADCLATTLASFPDLPLVRVRPQEFFGSQQEFAAACQRLDEFVAANPGDARALLLQAYVQWRQGMVDKALAALQAAQNAQPGQEISRGIAALMDGINRASEVILAEGPKTEAPRDFAWAGIRMGVPVGTKASALVAPNQVFSGVAPGKDANFPQLITLYAYSVAESVGPRAVMDSLAAGMGRLNFVKDMKIEAEAEVPFQTGVALVRIFTYADATTGSRIVTGWLGFVREGQPRVAYLVGVATAEQQANDVLPSLAAIAKTITLTEPQASPAGPPELTGANFADRQFAFSILQPDSWAGRQTDTGFEMGQMDFVRGNVVSPRAVVVVKAVTGATTAKGFGEDAIRNKMPKGMTRKILSESPASLAGHDGYQFVISQTPQDGVAGSPSVLVGRLILLDQPGGEKRLYALVVQCQDAQPADVEALTEKLAASFKLTQAQ